MMSAPVNLVDIVRTTPTIPLLDASSLPSDDDWALLESINVHADAGVDFEPDSDRFGRFNVSAAYDE
jgi:hypothetical protein